MSVYKFITTHTDLIPYAVTQTLQHKLNMQTKSSSLQLVQLVKFKGMRPDAIDLYVFSNDDKKHYDTCIMAKACLSYACKGLHAVVFYSYSGVFQLIKLSK